ncbi:hypothetical protein V2J09_023801 [Rumex salicifolius]
MESLQMAGSFGARISTSILLFKSRLLIFPKSEFIIYKNPNSFIFRSFRTRMAEQVTVAHPENVDSSPRIQSIHRNGVVSEAPLFKVKKLSEKAILPSRASPLSAGYDLSSAVDAKVPARGKALVATDLSIAIPEGTYARIAPRSGMAWKHSIDVGAGVIDADYRGPVGVILFNHSDVEFEVKAGDRIAQLIIEKIWTPEVVEVEDLDSTLRGAGGFGSTGV